MSFFNRLKSEYHKILPVYVVAIIEKNSGIFAPRTISVIFAATGNFNKDIDDCHNDVDKWMFLLKHSTRIMNFSDSFQSEVFKRVLEVLKISSFTTEEFDMYYTEEELKAIRQAQDEAAIEYGEKKGFARGKAEAKRETAKNLLALGVDINIIAQATGLTPEEIQAL